MPTPASIFFSSPDLLAASVSMSIGEREKGRGVRVRAWINSLDHTFIFISYLVRPAHDSGSPTHTPSPTHARSSRLHLTLTITPAHVRAADEDLGYRPPAGNLGHAGCNRVAVRQGVQFDHGRGDGQRFEQGFHFGAILER